MADPRESGSVCGSSIFDRTLCFCEPSGVMHTFACELEAGHDGDHVGRSECGDKCYWPQEADHAV